LPPIRIAPETKARLEAVLREGESLTQFIEGAVCREAEFRAEQGAAVSRAKEALRRADQGEGLLHADDFLAGMGRRAETAQQRIREAVAARVKGSAGGVAGIRLFRRSHSRKTSTASRRISSNASSRATPRTTPAC